MIIGQKKLIITCMRCSAMQYGKTHLVFLWKQANFTISLYFYVAINQRQIYIRLVFCRLLRIFEYLDEDSIAV